MAENMHDLIGKLKTQAKKLYPNLDPYEAMGYVIGDYCTNGVQIAKISAGAFENTNFHAQADTVRHFYQ